MQLKAPYKRNEQLPVCPLCTFTSSSSKLQHLRILWLRKWMLTSVERNVSKMAAGPHVEPSPITARLESLSPCLVLNAFQDTHEIKMTLMTHYFDSSCRHCAMKFLYQDSTSGHHQFLPDQWFLSSQSVSGQSALHSTIHIKSLYTPLTAFRTFPSPIWCISKKTHKFPFKKTSAVSVLPSQ